MHGIQGILYSPSKLGCARLDSPHRRQATCEAGQQTLPCGLSPSKSNGHSQVTDAGRLLWRQVIWRHNCFRYPCWVFLFPLFLSGEPEVSPADNTLREARRIEADRRVLEVTTLRGETKERWRELCERAVVEQDPDRFLTTIQELLQELEESEQIALQRNRVRVPPSEKPYITCPVPQVPVSARLALFAAAPSFTGTPSFRARLSTRNG